jgi:hypothetical protein
VLSFKKANSFDIDVRNELSNPAGTDLTAFYTNSFTAGPEYPRCGVRQRRWWALENCKPLKTQIGLNPTAIGSFFADTGVESFDIIPDIDDPASETCMMREPRTFSGRCSNGNMCNASGECVPDKLPPALTVISPPFPPQLDAGTPDASAPDASAP